MAANDGGFTLLKAKLTTTARPYNKFAGPTEPDGDPSDPAAYVLRPGYNFMRPWLAIRGGAAFQWPLGLEGFTMAVDPLLGIHKFIGDNAVTVDVIHAGEEHFTMTGNFPGDSAPDLVSALRDLVYKDSPDEGKILWLPEVVTYAQRVQITNFQSARDENARGRDMTYSIDFVRVGILSSLKLDPKPVAVTAQPTKPNKGKPSRSVTVDGAHNTLRKIALWKLGSAQKWRTVYDANQKWFVNHNVQLSKAPGYRLPVGLKLSY